MRKPHYISSCFRNNLIKLPINIIISIKFIKQRISVIEYRRWQLHGRMQSLHYTRTPSSSATIIDCVQCRHCFHTCKLCFCCCGLVHAFAETPPILVHPFCFLFSVCSLFSQQQHPPDPISFLLHLINAFSLIYKSETDTTSIFQLPDWQLNKAVQERPTRMTRVGSIVICWMNQT